MRNVEVVLFLVVLGTVVAAFASRLRIPAPSLLVIAGLAVGLLPWVPAVRVPPDAVSLVVLPPLLYAASEELPWRELRAVWRPVVILAVGLVLASAAAVAVVAGAVAGIPASLAFVLGSVLASTDPVDLADSLVQQLRVPPKFAYGTLAALRLLPLLSLEWGYIAMARRARGIEAGRSPVGALRLFISQVFGILVVAIRRGTRLATAMDARGFDSGLPRTEARTQRLGRADILLTMTVAAVSLGAVLVSVSAGTWRPLVLG